MVRLYSSVIYLCICSFIPFSEPLLRVPACDFSPEGGANHSNNDDSTIMMRQKDPHSHALVLDPYVGCVAYVPDLGKDLIREFFYDKNGGVIGTELNVLPSGLCTGKPDGPRYFVFHPSYKVAYVVNELSSTVSTWFLRVCHNYFWANFDFIVYHHFSVYYDCTAHTTGRCFLY